MPEPTWGFVTAAAHEHLVVLRNGHIHRAQQGGSVWKWPGDTVARIDTSVHRLQFTADQITRERVGKDALATELMAEVAPVVCGRGYPDDETDRGWGIAIDTIEIQDVRVMSEEVFERMQAPFRAELALSAVRAQAEVAAAGARVAAEVERNAEARRAELLALEEARVEAERARVRMDLDARLESARRAAEAGVETARLDAEARRLAAAAAADATRLERAALDHVSEARLQEIALTHTAPELARALRGAFGEIVVRPSDLTELVTAVRAVVA